jgi:choloylglycine hydrolase
MRAFTIVWVCAVATVATTAPADACSVFTAHDDVTVLAANNEDYFGDIPTILWFVPPEGDKHGYVAWGYADNHFSQGGMNDQGLFWDGLATPSLPIENCTGTKPFTLMTMEEVMQDSATVEEAIANLLEYDYSAVLEPAQFLFVDANGDSAIFEGDLVIYPDAVDYQIALNFYWSNPDLGGYPDWRLDVLSDMMESGLELTVDYFTEMADAAHQGTVAYDQIYTRYTTVAELGSGEFYLYYDLMYGYPIVFDLEEELELGPHEYDMYELFYGDADSDSDSDGDSDSDSDVDTDTDSDAGADAGTDGGDEGDCGCASTGAPSTGLAAVLLESLVP